MSTTTASSSLRIPTNCGDSSEMAGGNRWFSRTHISFSNLSPSVTSSLQAATRRAQLSALRGGDSGRHPKMPARLTTMSMCIGVFMAMLLLEWRILGSLFAYATFLVVPDAPQFMPQKFTLCIQKHRWQPRGYAISVPFSE
jgi:hypothetical protein